MKTGAGVLHRLSIREGVQDPPEKIPLDDPFESELLTRAENLDLAGSANDVSQGASNTAHGLRGGLGGTSRRQQLAQRGQPQHLSGVLDQFLVERQSVGVEGLA